MSEPILAVVKEVFSTVRGIDPELVVPGAKLAEDLGVDSLDAIEIILALEQRYNKEFDGDDIEELKTVNDVIALIGSIVS